MNLTDADIKELAIKHKLIVWKNDYSDNLLTFAQELIAITREKVLAELVNGNEPVAYMRGDCEALSWFQGDCNIPLYAMPPAPEGMQLVPIETTTEMIKACINTALTMRNSRAQDFYKAMLAAAPKKG